jgi:hypothetical protein
MRSLKILMVAVAAFTSTALGGVGEAGADESLPDCQATMGLCGAECSSFFLEDPPDPAEHCAEMCADYGGVVSSGWDVPHIWDPPDFWLLPGDAIICLCAWECPWYL